MTEAACAFGDIVAQVRKGEVPRPEELLSFLSVAAKTERAQRLSVLSEAFFEAGNIEQAARLVRRAIAVSGYDPRYLESCVVLLSRVGDIEGVRETLKRVGINAAKENRIVEALELFNRSLYAYATHCKQDRYVYDFEMLAAIDAMALRFRDANLPVRAEGRIRVAVLVFGALHVGSVLIRILATFAEQNVPDSSWHFSLRSFGMQFCGPRVPKSSWGRCEVPAGRFTYRALEIL
jgi:hypothetical protein